MKILQVENLTRDYGNNQGVFDLSFFVNKGEAFGFLGPNGAGKTTVIRHLMGFLQAQKGLCTIGGEDCWENTSLVQSHVGYIPGEMAFFDDMTGLDFLKFLASYRRVSDLARMEELIKYFDLDPQGKIKKMSKGMKQKVGIIAAFLHDPQVLIFDEPTSGLDPLMQNKFIRLILQEKKKGKTILMSSHMFEEVERTCDRVAIIKNGRLVATDDIESLKEKQIRKYIVSLKDEARAKTFAQENLKIEARHKNQVTVIVKNDLNKLLSIMTKYDIVDITSPKLNLEELFLQYYGGGVHG